MSTAVTALVANDYPELVHRIADTRNGVCPPSSVDPGLTAPPDLLDVGCAILVDPRSCPVNRFAYAAPRRH
jgi:hypothetical protein